MTPRTMREIEDEADNHHSIVPLLREARALGRAEGIEEAAKVAEGRCCVDGCTCCDFERNTVDLILALPARRGSEGGGRPCPTCSRIGTV